MLYLILEWSALRSRAFRGKNIPKISQNRPKSVQKSTKIGETLGTLSRDRPEQHLLMDFFDYLKKTFPPDSGRTGSPRANLRPFLKSPLNVDPFY